MGSSTTTEKDGESRHAFLKDSFQVKRESQLKTRSIEGL